MMFNGIKSLVYFFAHKYVRYYEAFSYNFEKNGEKYILDRLSGKKFSVIFDVGANVGDWTRTALQIFDQPQIHVFELTEANQKILHENLDKEPNCHVVNAGMSDKSGEFSYKDYGEGSEFNTLVMDGSCHDSKEVSVTRTATLVSGDAYCAENKIDHIDFLKIDVEGAEYAVLRGFENMLARKAIRAIQFEYGYLTADAHHVMKDFFSLLDKFGYRVGPLKPAGVLFMDFDARLNDFRSGPNYVAVRADDTELVSALTGRLQGFPS